MALRVLLADESTTIKKVFQLSLQDYAVDVKTCNVGVDVREVAEAFKPDVIFADVLLQQKSGYEVSSEIKSDDKLGHTPVVLMWSGFLELDEDKFQASGADAKLEKPFEVDKLRNLIHRLVPKTTEQKLSEYLTFPDMPDLEEVKSEGKSTVAPPPIGKISRKEDPALNEQGRHQNIDMKNDWTMEEFTDMANINDEDLELEGNEPFAQVDLSKDLPSREEVIHQRDKDLIANSNEDGDWIQGQIDDFKLDIEVDDNINAEDDEIPVESIIPADTLERITYRPRKTMPDDIPPLEEKIADSLHDDLDVEAPIENEPPPFAPPRPMSEEQLKQVIEAQSREVIEKVVWQVVPELATQIIEKELARLLAEKEGNL